MNQTNSMNTLVTSFYILGFLLESGSIKYKYDDTHVFSLEIAKECSSNGVEHVRVRIVRPFVCFDIFLY